jgi:hypothetical protein
MMGNGYRDERFTYGRKSFTYGRKSVEQFSTQSEKRVTTKEAASKRSLTQMCKLDLSGADPKRAV